MTGTAETQLLASSHVFYGQRLGHEERALKETFPHTQKGQPSEAFRRTRGVPGHPILETRVTLGRPTGKGWSWASSLLARSTVDGKRSRPQSPLGTCPGWAGTFTIMQIKETLDFLPIFFTLQY